MKVFASKLTAVAMVLAMMMMVLAGAAAPMPVSAAASGPLLAGAGASADGPGTNAWASAGNIVASDGSCADSSLGWAENATSEYLQATNYGFNIPLNTIINGIAVSIMRRDTSGNGAIDAELHLLKGGAMVGANHAVSTKWPTTLTIANYGGAADLWGTTWTPAEINSPTFGLSLSATNTHPAASRTASVDYTEITVTYTILTATTTTVAASAGSSTYGDMVTLTATVTRSEGTNTPSGTVDFYDGGVSIGFGTLSDIGGGAATATFTISSLAAGSHNITAVYAGDSIFAGSTGTLAGGQTVNPVSITVTADDQVKVYGAADPALTYQITSGSLVAGDSFTGVIAREPGESAGPYDIQQGALTLSGNYNLTFIEGTLTISPKALTITANSGDKAYGDTAAFAGTEFTAVGLLAGDSVGSVTLTSTGAAADAAVGTYPIVPSAAVGTGLANYDISYDNGTLTVHIKNNISVDATAVAVGQTVSFGVTSTGGAAPLHYEWDFDNDGVWDSTDQNPTHIYRSAGTYSVAIRATDSAGNSYTQTKIGFIEVSATTQPRPEVWHASVTGGAPGQSLTLVLTGAKFTGAASVDFGYGISVDSYTVDSDSQITAEITIDPDARPRGRHIVVTTPAGDSVFTESFSIAAEEDSTGLLGSWWFWLIVALLAVFLGLVFFLLLKRRKREAAAG